MVPIRTRTLKLYAALDLVIVTTLVGAYIWRWRSGSGYQRAAAVIALLVWSVLLQWVRKRRLSEIAGRLNTFYPALRQVAAWILPAILVIVVLATIRVREESPLGLPPPSQLATRLLILIALGLLQQYLLIAHLWRSACDLSASERIGVGAAAVIFALLHAPNGFLMGLTLVGGWVACRIYCRNPNLIALAVGHGCLSFTVYYGLPRAVTAGLRFGPGYG